jgi:hypothetical protein
MMYCSVILVFYRMLHFHFIVACLATRPDTGHRRHLVYDANMTSCRREAWSSDLLLGYWVERPLVSQLLLRNGNTRHNLLIFRNVFSLNGKGSTFWKCSRLIVFKNTPCVVFFPLLWDKNTAWVVWQTALVEYGLESNCHTLPITDPF